MIEKEEGPRYGVILCQPIQTAVYEVERDQILFLEKGEQMKPQLIWQHINNRGLLGRATCCCLLAHLSSFC